MSSEQYIEITEKEVIEEFYNQLSKPLSNLYLLYIEIILDNILRIFIYLEFSYKKADNLIKTK